MGAFAPPGPAVEKGLDLLMKGSGLGPGLCGRYRRCPLAVGSGAAQGWTQPGLAQLGASPRIEGGQIEATLANIFVGTEKTKVKMVIVRCPGLAGELLEAGHRLSWRPEALASSQDEGAQVFGDEDSLQ